MIICLAQTRPIKGNLEGNIASHLRFIDLAIAAGASLVLFPELSVTGYEPTLAKDLATTTDDDRFNVFQKLSDEKNVVIGVGAPLTNNEGVTISLLLFRPDEKREAYSKQFLHADEEPFFVSGKNSAVLFDEKENIALAICYELSVPEHAERAARSGAKIYLASVAKTAEGIGKASERLAQIARDYAMATLMVNCLGVNDGVLCSGGSSAWSNKGELIGRLDDGREGLLLFDTETENVTERYVH